MDFSCAACSRFTCFFIPAKRQSVCTGCFRGVEQLDTDGDVPPRREAVQLHAGRGMEGGGGAVRCQRHLRNRGLPHQGQTQVRRGKGLALEAVSLEDVEASPQGIHGWADINISVPGIEEASTSGDPVPTTPAGSITRKRSHSTSPEDEEKAPANTASDSKGPGSNKKPKAENPKAKPAAKKKSESQELRMAEKSAKNLIVLIQRAQQVVDTITGHVDSFPSEWAWSKSFLEEFHRLQGQLRTALSPASGDDLTEFVNELKISVISPSEAKQMKKKFGERYQAMLTLFVDRCTAVSEQFLGFNNLFPGPATLAILK